MTIHMQEVNCAYHSGKLDVMVLHELVPHVCNTVVRLPVVPPPPWGLAEPARGVC